MNMNRYISIRQKEYPNPCGLYKVTIWREGNNPRMRNYVCSEERAEVLLQSMKYPDPFLDGGCIVIHGMAEK